MNHLPRWQRILYIALIVIIGFGMVAFSFILPY